MNAPVLMNRFAVVALMFVVMGAVLATDEKAPTDAQLIARAMQAAPARVAKDATIVAMEAGGKMRTLRKGRNGFTYMPDNPETPGPDSMCMGKNATEWVHAYLGRKTTPPGGKLGLMSMLAGGTDASNTDPYATKPSASNHWVKTGPHGMIVGAQGRGQAHFSRAASEPDPVF